MESAIVKAFMPSKFGNKVLTSKNELLYLPESVKVEAGMEIMFSRHKAGETCTLLNGNSIEFKVEGIHDIFITQSANVAAKIAVAKATVQLADVE